MGAIGMHSKVGTDKMGSTSELCQHTDIENEQNSYSIKIRKNTLLDECTSNKQ